MEGFPEKAAPFLLAKIPFLEAEAIDLDPHKGSVALVKIEQDKHVLVFCKPNVSLEQAVSDFRVALVIEIHGQEGQIGRDISVSKALIEFDAIKDLNSIGKINMCGSQVPVAITNLSRFNTMLKELLSSAQEGSSVVPNNLKLLLVKYLSYKHFRLPEVLLAIRPNRFA